MKELSFEALAVLLLLLPGFLCSRVLQVLTVRRKQSEFESITEAFIFSFLIYVAYALFQPKFPFSVVSEAGDYTIELYASRLLGLTAISISIAITLAASETHDLFGRLFRLAGITSRSTRNSIWADVFHEFNGIAQVELADGRCVVGWLRRCSDRPEESTIHLQRAHWLEVDGKQTNAEIPSILLTKSCGIKSVMLFPESEERRAGEQSTAVAAVGK